jgi:DNA-binding GntR family transcriptional regulator
MNEERVMTLELPSTKTEFVYRTLRSAILDGQLVPGQRLRLAELASRYAISEMPVREALRKLQHDGLVEFENHRGATVSDLSLERTVEIIVATRTYLEVCAVCEAAPHHTPETLAELDALIQKMKKTRKPELYSELNRRFHKWLTEPCPNSFLKSEKVWQTRSQSIFQLVPERLADATREHEEIVLAIKSGSVEKVRQAAMLHRERTLRSWRSLVKREERAAR